MVDSVHVAPTKIPPLPPSPHATVPVGVLGEPLVSVTVTVKVTEFPMVTEAGLGVMLTEVVSSEGLVTLNVETPELAECVESPG